MQEIQIIGYNWDTILYAIGGFVFLIIIVGALILVDRESKNG